MKVIQISFCFYPDLVGGTEVYVASLAQLLKASYLHPLLITGRRILGRFIASFAKHKDYEPFSGSFGRSFVRRFA